MEKSLTEGNPLKLIIQFSIPLLLGNLFQQAYNLVDSALVGHYLGTSSLAAVGSSSSVQFLVLGFCMGISSGFAIPVANRFGAKDYSGMRRIMFNAGLLTVFFAVIITLGCTVFCNQILYLLSTPEDIFMESRSYLFMTFLGIPFMLFYNLLSNFLRSVGDSKTPFYFLLISTFLNIGLDLAFIIIFKFGVMGAALATVVSQAVAGILTYIHMRLHFEILHFRKEDRYVSGKDISVLFGMGVPMGLQFSITAIGSMIMQSANNNLGSLYISSFTAGTKIRQLTMAPFDSLATAVSTFASQNYGAGKLKRVRQGLYNGVGVGVSYGILIGLVFLLFGRTLSLVFIDSSETLVIENCYKYLFSVSFFMWVLGILNVSRMTVQGLGYSKLAVFSGVLEMIARSITGFVLVPLYGYQAICFADQTAWIAGTVYVCIICHFCLKKVGKEMAKSAS